MWLFKRWGNHILSYQNKYVTCINRKKISNELFKAIQTELLHAGVCFYIAFWMKSKEQTIFDHKKPLKPIQLSFLRCPFKNVT